MYDESVFVRGVGICMRGYLLVFVRGVDICTRGRYLYKGLVFVQGDGICWYLYDGWYLLVHVFVRRVGICTRYLILLSRSLINLTK